MIDGDSVAYIDRSGNGDLTEPADRVELDAEATGKIKLGNPGAYKAMHVFPLGEVAGTKLVFQLWVRDPDFDLSKNKQHGEVLRQWDKNKWVNGTLYRIAKDGSQAQNPLLLTSSPADAQITHFDGPLTFELKWLDQQRLEPWPKQTVFDVNIGTRNLVAKGSEAQGFGSTRLTTTEVPANVHPVATFEFPAASPHGTPIIREVQLDQRCCGDTFYALFTLPPECKSGNVKVTVECPLWAEHYVLPGEFKIPINQGFSRYGEFTYVMFHNLDIKIEDAVDALRKRGLNVFIQPDRLVINESGKPAFSVTLVRNKNVLEMSAELAKGSKYSEKLGRCDARFEVGFDPEKVLSEPKTLEEIQVALRELTDGYLYNTWDKALTDGTGAAAAEVSQKITGGQPAAVSASAAVAGDTNAGWVKYEHNPVLGGKLGTCFDVSVLKEGATCRMWFSWRPKKSIALVESQDGFHWSEPRIVLGPTSSGWEDDVNRPAVIKQPDGYHLWYTGQAKGHSQIGHATSKDGVTWTRASDKPVLSPEAKWEKVAVMCPDVIWDEEAKQFRMWYSGGEQYEPDAIGYATSQDGDHWTKAPENPMFNADPKSAWEQHKVTACQVVKHRDWFYMFYIGFRDVDHAQIGLARSRDGVHNWQRHPANPIISPTPGGWDHDAVYKPSAIFDGERWRLWYNGRHGGVEQIGLATHLGEDLGFPSSPQ